MKPTAHTPITMQIKTEAPSTTITFSLKTTAHSTKTIQPQMLESSSIPEETPIHP
jgi:hypothetical protein